MKKIYFAIVGLFLFTGLKAQIKYTTGSYTSVNGVTETGYILLDDTVETPQNFLFKNKLEDEPIVLSNASARSFAINSYGEQRKFVYKSILIYDASEKYDLLDNKREVTFEQKELFIELLIGSDVSLYKLKRKNLIDLYFFTDSSDKTTTLVMKKYKGYQNQIKTNNSFKQQLSTALNCSDNTSLNFDVLEYRERSLISLFQKYITCTNRSTEFTLEKERQKLFNFKVLAGAGRASLTSGAPGNSEVTFDNSSYGVFGGEFEYHFNKKRKWSLVFNAATFNFSNVGSNEVQLNFPASGTLTIENEAEISGLDLNFGIRNYTHLNQNSSIFVGLFFGLDINSETSFKFLNIDREEIVADQGAPNFALGLGYEWKKISVEIKLHTAKDHLGEGTFFRSSSLNQSSITLRYQIFNF